MLRHFYVAAVELIPDNGRVTAATEFEVKGHLFALLEEQHYSKWHKKVVGEIGSGGGT